MGSPSWPARAGTHAAGVRNSGPEPHKAEAAFTARLCCRLPRATAIKTATSATQPFMASHSPPALPFGLRVNSPPSPAEPATSAEGSPGSWSPPGASVSPPRIRGSWRYSVQGWSCCVHCTRDAAAEGLGAGGRPPPPVWVRISKEEMLLLARDAGASLVPRQVPWDGCDEGPHTRQLKTTGLSFPAIWRTGLSDEGVAGPLGGGGRPFLPLPASGAPVSLGGHPVSASVFTWLLRVCPLLTWGWTVASVYSSVSSADDSCKDPFRQNAPL